MRFAFPMSNQLWLRLLKNRKQCENVNLRHIGTQEPITEDKRDTVIRANAPADEVVHSSVYTDEVVENVNVS
jgi:hypothetical protein